jgi:hypothetical protein
MASVFYNKKKQKILSNFKLGNGQRNSGENCPTFLKLQRELNDVIRVSLSYMLTKENKFKE